MAAARREAEEEGAEEATETERETEQEQEVEEVETEETGEELETEAETETDPEAEAEAEGEADEAEPPSRETRGNRQFGALRAENRDLKRRLDALERGRQADPAADAARQQREKEDEERVLLSADPAAISKFYTDRAVRQLSSELQPLKFHTVDQADQGAFSRACAKSEALASVADEVEERLAQFRANGANPQRVMVARLILGERVEQRANRARGRQEKKAATERQRHAARPGSSRSDVRPAGGRASRDTHAERAKRLDESGNL